MYTARKREQCERLLAEMASIYREISMFNADETRRLENDKNEGRCFL